MMVYRLTCTGLEIPTPLPNAYLEEATDCFFGSPRQLLGVQ
jgi:hypothetical protein